MAMGSRHSTCSNSNTQRLPRPLRRVRAPPRVAFEFVLVSLPRRGSSPSSVHQPFVTVDEAAGAEALGGRCRFGLTHRTTIDLADLERSVPLALDELAQ